MTPDGGKVYLVGTAHFSMESQEDVAKVRCMSRKKLILAISFLFLVCKKLGMEDPRNKGRTLISFAVDAGVLDLQFSQWC
jgi:hypothetical protein